MEFSVGELSSFMFFKSSFIYFYSLKSGDFLCLTHDTVFISRKCVSASEWLILTDMHVICISFYFCNSKVTVSRRLIFSVKNYLSANFVGQINILMSYMQPCSRLLVSLVTNYKFPILFMVQDIFAWKPNFLIMRRPST